MQRNYINLIRYIFLDIIYFEPTGRKNPKIILHQYVFETVTKTPKHTTWKCVSYYKTKCRAKLYTHGRTARLTGEHNHPRTTKNVTDLPFAKFTVINARPS